MRSIMRILLVLAAGLVCAGIVPAQIESLSRGDPDTNLARKSGLTVAETRSLRMAMGIPDTPFSRSISAIDANSLKPRNHILVVESQRTCLVLHVFERGPSGFREIWSLSAVPSPDSLFGPSESTQSQRICAQAPIPPRVRGTADARIVLEIPVLDDPSQRAFPPYIYSFSWDGSVYKLDATDR